MRKPNLTARENEHLIELLAELALEMRGSNNFPQPKPIYTKDFEKKAGGSINIR